MPSMVMIDAQTVKGGRYGPTFHKAGGRGGRTIGTKRTILVEILGLPMSARADPARPHDVRAGRDLLRDRLDGLPRVAAIVADRGYRGLAKPGRSRNASARHQAPPPPGRRVASPRSRRSTRSSTPSPSSAAGGGCRAATRAPRRARGPGSKSPRSATCSGGRDRLTDACRRTRSVRPLPTSASDVVGVAGQTGRVRLTARRRRERARRTAAETSGH